VPDCQFAINDDGGLLRVEGSANDQGIAFDNTVILHTVTLNLHEEDSCGMLDEMLIKTEDNDSAVDAVVTQGRQ